MDPGRSTVSIMGVVPPAKARIGTAVNDATGELRGTRGVAVIGSVATSVQAARLHDAAFSAGLAP